MFCAHSVTVVSGWQRKIPSPSGVVPEPSPNVEDSYTVVQTEKRGELFFHPREGMGMAHRQQSRDEVLSPFPRRPPVSVKQKKRTESNLSVCLCVLRASYLPVGEQSEQNLVQRKYACPIVFYDPCLFLVPLTGRNRVHGTLTSIGIMKPRELFYYLLTSFTKCGLRAHTIYAVTCRTKTWQPRYPHCVLLYLCPLGGSDRPTVY